VSEITSSSVTLSWLPPLSDGGAALTAYVVEKREKMSPVWSRVARLKPQTTSYTIVNLAEKTDYLFRVYAENVEGAGSPLTLDRQVTPRRPAGIGNDQYIIGIVIYRCCRFTDQNIG